MARSASVTHRTLMLLLSLIVLLAGCGGDEASIPPFDLYEGIGIADLNNDTLPDVAVAYRHISGAPPHPGYVAVLLQNPAKPGSFLTPVSYPVGGDPWTLRVADLNADMLPDIVVVNNSTYSVSVLYQQTGNTGRFEAARQFATTLKPSGLAVADIDGDGLPDLAVAGYGGTSAPDTGLAILRQDAGVAKSFLSPLAVTTGSSCESVAVADVNHDGAIDLVVDGATDVRVILQDVMTPMTFAAPVLLTAGVRPAYVELADFDRDGLLDILVANTGSDVDGSGASVSFLRQNPAQAGEFLAPVQFATASGARSFVLTDLNGDSYPDLAVATVILQSQQMGMVSVLLQNPAVAGTVTARVDYRAGYTPYFIAAGDLNNDAHPDLAVTDAPVILWQNPLQPGTFQPPVNLLP